MNELNYQSNLMINRDENNDPQFIKWADLDESKKHRLLDLNFYFKRMDKVLDYMEKLQEQINEKKHEANNIAANIESSLNALLDKEQMCEIKEDIETLNDLIFVSEKYGSTVPNIKFNVDVTLLHKIREPLKKLKDVIGMENIKDQVVDQVLTSIQNLYDDDLLFHTVIKGPPGVGKTMLAKILGEIYLNMGILKGDKLIFNVAKRSDLIGKYLGHTAVKTQDFINKCKGGVMFIDEVYSLGNNEKKDSFSKECIDTINLNLLEKKNFICIIAGYSDEVEQCFFDYNPGLKRRFPFSYEINGYTGKELTNILIHKIKISGWFLDESLGNGILGNFIENKKNSFVNHGGDVDTLILNAKISHGRRVFGKKNNLKKIISLDDIKKGFDRMLQTRQVDNSKIEMMYT